MRQCGYRFKHSKTRKR